MDTSALTPPVPVTNPNLSDNLKALLKGLQSLNDQSYISEVRGYLDRSQAWIDKNVSDRQKFIDGGGDPTSFVSSSFTSSIPFRTVYDYDNNGVPVYRQEADSRLAPPTLPAYVKPAPPVSTGFVSTASQVEAAAATKEALIFSVLIDIQTKVNKLLSKLP